MSNRKVRKPNVVRGGTAVPLGRNYYYMSGRKHENGGIDIGRNPRTGLEVEDGEVMHVGKNEVKVFSSVPFLNGKSPAEKVMEGDNPNDVFNAQESFKKRNKINDDGTKKKRMGGLNRSKDYGSKSKPYPSVKSGDFAGGGRSYPIPTKADAVDALRLAGLHGRSDVKAKIYNKYPELRKKSKAGGLYSVTVDGKTKLKMFPSTGEQTKSTRVKAKDGVKYKPYEDYDVVLDDTFSLSHANSFPNYGIETNMSDEDINKALNRFKDNNGNKSELNTNNKSKSNSNSEPINTFGLTSSPWYDRLTRNIERVNIPEISPILGLSYIPKSSNKSKSTNRKINKTITNSNINATNNEIKSIPYTKSRLYIPDIDRNIPNQIYKQEKDENINKDNNKDVIKNTLPSIKKFINDNPNTVSDGIGLTSNILGSIISHKMNKDILNKMQYTPQPISRTATKLKTKININPQLDKMRESLASYERAIDANTGSSQVALARKQRARLANILSTNELFGNKENMETALINQDRLNQQSVANANIADYNRWAEGRAAFRNAILEKKAENDVALAETLNAGIQDLIGRREKRKSENQTITAMTLANPDLPIEVFYEQGLINKKTYEAYKKAYRNKKKND